MTRILYITTSLAFALFARLGFAYDPNTHEAISSSAVQASVLGQQSVLNEMGLQYAITDDKQKFPNGRGDERSVFNLFREGARFEDDNPRPANHFYDPISKRGVSGWAASPDWAIDGTGDSSTTKFSYKAAREYFYEALTDRSKNFRDARFGLMFRSLGQVIHHIQDMAQPQHTRLDLHCDVFPCRLIGQFALSVYERYTV